jgi:hypothetical protein
MEIFPHIWQAIQHSQPPANRLIAEELGGAEVIGSLNDVDGRCHICLADLGADCS